MSTDSPSPTGMRLPLVISATMALGMTAIFCFILLSSYHYSSLGSGEIAFLCAYSFFCSVNWIFAWSVRSWIDSRLPSWLNRRWVRFLLCFILALALAGLLKLLHLPVFYDAVIDKSIIFLLLPYVIGFGQTSWLFGATQGLKPGDSTWGEDRVLRMNPRKAYFLLIGSLVFVVLGICMLHVDRVVAWIGIGFFGFGIPSGILMLLTGGYTLSLKSDEFTVTMLWRRFSFPWCKVADFIVLQTPQGSRVGFNFHPDPSGQAPAWKKEITARKWLMEMYGRNAILPDDFGLPAVELCRIMAARSTGAQRCSQSTES